MLTPTDRREAVPTPDALADLLYAVSASRDHAAFAALFRHFAPRIKAYLIRGGVAPGQAEDLAQEAMVNVWRKAASFDRSRAAASTWIFTIARNLRIDQLRHERDAVPSATLPGDDADEVQDIVDTGALPCDHAASAQIGQGVRAAIDSLPPEQARVLQLSFYEEQPHVAIAEALGIPLGTVKSRIRLAVGQLRQRLEHLKS
ncbi:sigma-70 family RNA polymerase sigma factor [Uliginosibacterium sp. H1]|uniref:sigma-70 family RNA polymerase sigma factor n=1 Tax=Uliginosibacterium sp. H1 TaxID=3114757 RepID=UPI002E191F20|nr:sigma-70 family RNA polymerase sigma factor [Uliginosibacterium sp. H1]